MLDASQLVTAGRQVRDTLSPQSIEIEDTEHQRRRNLTLIPHADGSAELRGHLTQQCRALWEVIISTLSAPQPAIDGTPDERHHGQRAHDGFADAAHLLVTGGNLPSAGGLPSTLIITMTLHDLETRIGRATTAHGGTLAIDEALDLASEAHVIPVLMNDTGGILNYGRGRRLAPAALRYALIARDKGCTFPGCDRPPSWTQAHHIQEWLDDGETSLDNLTLLCRRHHREFATLGWTVHLTDGIPEWTPPARIDPTRTPQRNTTHEYARA